MNHSVPARLGNLGLRENDARARRLGSQERLLQIRDREVRDGCGSFAFLEAPDTRSGSPCHLVGADAVTSHGIHNVKVESQDFLQELSSGLGVRRCVLYVVGRYGLVV